MLYKVLPVTLKVLIMSSKTVDVISVHFSLNFYNRLDFTENFLPKAIEELRGEPEYTPKYYF